LVLVTDGGLNAILRVDPVLASLYSRDQTLAVTAGERRRKLNTAAFDG